MGGLRKFLHEQPAGGDQQRGKQERQKVGPQALPLFIRIEFRRRFRFRSGVALLERDDIFGLSLRFARHPPLDPQQIVEAAGGGKIERDGGPAFGRQGILAPAFDFEACVEFGRIERLIGIDPPID